MLRRAFRLCLAGFLLFGACSSAPDTPEEVFEKRNQAARNMEAGNRYFREAAYNQALEFYQMALDSYTAMDDSGGHVTALNSMGKVFFLAGEEEKAQGFYDKAWASARKSRQPALIIQSANNRGELALRRGENNKALETFRTALEMGAADASGTLELAVLYHNMGASLRNAGDFAGALDCVLKAADMNRAAKRFSELASNYYLLSSIHFRQDKLEEAKTNALAALEYDKKMENSPGIAQDLLALGAVAQKTGDTEEAHDAYKRSFLVYRSLGVLSGMRNSLEKLIDTSLTLNLKEENEHYREAYKQLQPKAQ
ncbi:MAG: tetratricopeptide repeat protein [Spirochaetales bacterium]|jgi:tetratricopeptide (TPR) repeat protein|nr:tetratricopeptide repeat protein [Spirochaetales bacterium]